MTARRASTIPTGKGWREAGRGEDVPIDRLAYAALVYVGDNEADARAGAEKFLWYITANKVPPHFAFPPGYAPAACIRKIMRGDVGDQHRISPSRPPSRVRSMPA